MSQGERLNDRRLRIVNTASIIHKSKQTGMDIKYFTSASVGSPFARKLKKASGRMISIIATKRRVTGFLDSKRMKAIMESASSEELYMMMKESRPPGISEPRSTSAENAARIANWIR